MSLKSNCLIIFEILIILQHNSVPTVVELHFRHSSICFMMHVVSMQCGSVCCTISSTIYIYIYIYSSNINVITI